MDNKFKYFAFISYNSADTVWGKRLHRKLEYYRIPSTQLEDIIPDSKWLRPIFFAPYEIQVGDLSDELKQRLDDSRNLIVICSPNSAKSMWVGREISYFHSLNRQNHIFFFIVDGVPNSGDPKTECYNPVMKPLGLDDDLGANIHEKIFRWSWLNRERAFAQLISKLLGIEFDAIWKRHKRRLINKILAWTLGLVFFISAIVVAWKMNSAVDVEMMFTQQTEQNDSLPPLSDAIVSITLDNETKTDTLHSLGYNIVFRNVPRKFIGKEVRATFNCENFLPLDTTVTLSSSLALPISRDPDPYGNLHFRLWDLSSETGLGNTVITIDGTDVTTDEKGYVSLQIPVERQKSAYSISSLRLGLHVIKQMPCGPDDAVAVAL